MAPTGSPVDAFATSATNVPASSQPTVEVFDGMTTLISDREGHAAVSRELFPHRSHITPTAASRQFQRVRGTACYQRE
jgi:hypothetical protein